MNHWKKALREEKKSKDIPNIYLNSPLHFDILLLHIYRCHTLQRI